MTRQERIEWIGRACDHHACSEKIRKLHFNSFVDDQWNCHPPKRFVEWWSRHPDCLGGPSAVTAYNARSYRDQYDEARYTGLILNETET